VTVANLVGTGAAMKCSMGSAPGTFTASGEAASAGTAAGVVSDIGTESIPGFGMCSSPGNQAVSSSGSAQPCTPVITSAWTPGSSSVTIGGTAALNDTSECACTLGGTITISSAGQTAATLG
jgi:hypothetical protein